MKKFIAVLLVVTLLIGTVGCGRNEEPNNNNNNGNGTVGSDASSKELMDLVSRMYENLGDLVPFPLLEEIPLSQSERIETLTGLTDLSDVEMVINGGAAMSAIPYLFALVQIKEGADVDAIMDKMASSIDLGQLICVFAEAAVITNSGNLIMLVMGTQEQVDGVFEEFRSQMGTTGRKLEKAL